MPEVIAALGWCEARDALAEQGPERLDRSTARGAHQAFELRETLFDRIEIRTVRGQVPKRRAGGLDQRLHALDMMRGEVVGDDDVAWRQRGDQDLLDVREKLSPSIAPSMTPGAVSPLTRRPAIKVLVCQRESGA